jgi:UDP-N-acetylmuramoylalanine--D-glutamate ligase
LGGLAKTQDLDACAPYYSHVRAAYTFGRDGPMLADILRLHVPVVESETLEQSVAKAHAAAIAGDTVLLSPACASQDQFRDFEERGDCFRHAVLALSGQGA